MSEKLKDKINSLRKKNLLTDKDKLKTPEDVKQEINDVPERQQKKETTIDKVKKAKGGRIHLKGGGICIRGMNKDAFGKNS